jgi:hypothetical protein
LSAASAAPGPFLISVSHADGSCSRLPARGYAELSALLGAMARACEKAGVPTSPTTVWRVDRGEPRAMSLAELEEGELHELAILAC